MQNETKIVQTKEELCDPASKKLNAFLNELYEKRAAQREREAAANGGNSISIYDATWAINASITSCPPFN